ncbi:hypothetical protein DFQ26_009520 [Actinomortierella ambigua]|nr:hypothetical protein DFQ26_009520 [Actinomortierella ambigua]
MDSDGEEHSGTTTPSAVDIETAARTFSLDNLPSDFVTFLHKNDIDPAIYTVADLPRYVRLNPDPHNTITAEELSDQLGVSVEPVPGLELFCRLPAKVRLRQSQAYTEGRIFGMDLSSGIAVYALDVQPGDHVLDICCAPGAKLCMIAGQLTNSGGVQSDRTSSSTKLQMHITGTVTGVDISHHRLATCRNLLKRHRLQQHARLFQADGTTFHVLRPSALDHIRAKILAGVSKATDAKTLSSSGTVTTESHGEREKGLANAPSSGVRRRSLVENVSTGESQIEDDGPVPKKPRIPVENTASGNATPTSSPSSSSSNLPLSSDHKKSLSTTIPFYAPKILRKDPQLQGEIFKYDKVIVDAECTHDGSIAHILKYETWGWDSFHKNFMAQDRLDSLCELQRGLLTNGFRLAKVGGTIVYSTCSLSRAQNEDIVAWFLASFQGHAVLEPVSRESLGVLPATCKKPSQRIVASALGWIPSEDQHLEEELLLTSEQEAEIVSLEQQVVDGCLRFDPLASRTSGFFLARFRKVDHMGI